MATTVMGKGQVKVSANADTVWAAMKDYGNLSWSAGIAETRVRGEGIGMVRSVRLEGADDWMDEELYAVDDSARKFDYGIKDGMPGVDNYLASAQAIADDGGCIIQWQCSGDVDDDLAEDMRALMDVMAAEIARLFGTQFN